jgi:transposase
MAYRYGERQQMNLFPQSIEDYVATGDPVRAYDAFVNAVNLKELGITWDENQVGNPEYDPTAMLKLLVYGYSYGIRSSRKLERAIHHNISFIWLMGGLHPDHNNKKALQNMLKQCARLCVELGLIEGNTLFVDGSKIRANGSINNTWTMDKAKHQLKNIDDRIRTILEECEQTDNQEHDNGSLVQLADEFKDQEALKAKVERIVNELHKTNKTSINGTDPDCVMVKGRQGTHAGYNGQIVVDEKHGLIVHSDVVNENTDRHQFAAQIEQADATLEKQCHNACGDAGYAYTHDLAKIGARGTVVIVPSQKQAHSMDPEGPFSKEQFRYDDQKDCYVCPTGNEIPYSHFSTQKQHKSYRFSNDSVCRACAHHGVCTRSKRGRTITRLPDEESKIKFEQIYRTPYAQAIYALRKQKVELPFGHIKRNLGVGAFLLRGLQGVKAEMALLGTCFNIARMITILGVAGFTRQITA